MIEVDFNEAKIRLMSMIDTWEDEIINDLLTEIKTSADNHNLRDIGLTLETIKSTQKRVFGLKQNLMKSSTIQQVFYNLDCGILENVEGIILSRFLGIDVELKK